MCLSMAQPVETQAVGAKWKPRSRCLVEAATMAVCFGGGGGGGEPPGGGKPWFCWMPEGDDEDEEDDEDEVSLLIGCAECALFFSSTNCEPCSATTFQVVVMQLRC